MSVATMTPEEPKRWGDLDDDEDGLLGNDLPPREVIGPIDGVKTVIEYRINEETGKTEKVTTKYRVEKLKRKIAPAVVARKSWAKFGDSAKDPPGPNPSTTVVTDDVHLKLTSETQALDKNDAQDDPQAKLTAAKGVSCRTCGGAHWTRMCPLKDTLPAAEDLAAALNGETPKADEPIAAPLTATGEKRYVPPGQRKGNSGRGESMRQRQVDDAATVRVTNLSEDVREKDLHDLFQRFGVIQRIFLAKEKLTQQSKGFAFISFLRRDDAARAIEKLSGFGYDHLILQVEWARPPSSTPA